MRPLLALLALLAVASPALAGNFFEPANGWESDDSFRFLSYLFGEVVHTLAMTGSIATTNNTVLADLAGELNSAILMIGVIIMTYTYLAGSIHTANDGEFLGKKWSSWSVPLRTAGSIAVLLPTAGGYCVLQLALLWGTLQGIGLADKALDTGMAYFAQNKGLTQPVVPASAAIPVNDLMSISLCNKIANDGESGVGGITKVDAPIDSGISTSLKNIYAQLTQGSATTVDMTAATGGTVGYDYKLSKVQAGYCGKVRWVKTQTTVEETATGSTPPSWAPAGTTYSTAPSAPFVIPEAGYQQYLTDVFSYAKGCTDYLISGTGTACATRPLAGIADKIMLAAKGDDDAKRALSGGGEYDRAIEKIQAEVAANYKAKILDSLNTNVLNTLDTNSGTVSGISGSAYINSIVKAITEHGWVYAGSFYMRLASVNSVVQGLVNNSAFYSVPAKPDWAMLGAGSNSLTTAALSVYGAYMSGSASQFGRGTQPTTGEGAATVDESSGSLLDMFRHSTTSLALSIMSALGVAQVGSDYTDPMIDLKNIGDNLIVAVEAALLALSAMMAYASINPGTRLASAVFSTSQPGMQFLVFIGSGLFLAVAVPLLGFGAYLSTYLPMLPFVFWAMGVISYFILVLEATFAAPLWAIAHMHPEGHEIVGKGSPGYMFVLALLIRPVLMVVFLFGSLILIKPVIWFINTAFIEAFRAMQAGSFTGLVTLVAGIALYAVLATKAIAHVFSLVNNGPDRILRWIGGGDSVGAEANSLQSAVHGGTQSGINTLGGGLRTVADSAQKFGKQRAASLGGGRGAGAAGSAAQPSVLAKQKEELNAMVGGGSNNVSLSRR